MSDSDPKILDTISDLSESIPIIDEAVKVVLYLQGDEKSDVAHS